MRQYKFRGKRLADGKWTYGWLVIEDNGTAWISRYYHKGEWEQVDPETVGQFTEQHDINGKEIYEGHDVKWTSLYLDTGEEATGEVTFFEGGWFIQGDRHNGHLNDCLTCEIIEKD